MALILLYNLYLTVYPRIREFESRLSMKIGKNYWTYSLIIQFVSLYLQFMGIQDP